MNFAFNSTLNDRPILTSPISRSTTFVISLSWHGRFTGLSKAFNIRMVLVRKDPCSCSLEHWQRCLVVAWRFRLYALFKNAHVWASPSQYQPLSTPLVLPTNFWNSSTRKKLITSIETNLTISMVFRFSMSTADVLITIT